MKTEMINYSTPKSIDKFVSITGIPDSLIDAAKAKLIELLKVEFPDLEIDPKQIILEKFRSVMWPDASIGCPQPGHVYSQMLTPGYTIGFQIGEKHYTMHTDATGALIASPDFPSQG
jgi:hypothetical protein